MRFGRTNLTYFAIAHLALALQPDQAVLRKVFEDALTRRQQTFGSHDPRTAQAARDLGFFLKEAGDRKAAATAFSQALQIDEASYGPNGRQTLAGLIALASVSDSRDAEALLRRALASPGTDAQLAVPALSTLGDLRREAGDQMAAAGYWRLALKQAESLYGQGGPPVAKILNSLAGVVDGNEAVGLLERATEIALHTWGERHPETATAEVNLARAFLKAGRVKDAIDKARQSVAVFEATLGPQHPRVAIAITTLADAQRANHDAAGAESNYRRVLEIDRQTLGTSDQQTLRDVRTLMALLRANGRVRQALELERAYAGASQ